MSNTTKLIERLYKLGCGGIPEAMDAADALTAQAATIVNLKTVMVAAAEEISAHWDAHCDAEGYGPANLMRRLEDGIPSEYGYTAGAFAKQAATIAEQARELEVLRADAERWKSLYQRAINVANGLTNYVEERPELTHAERRLDKIESEARAAMQSGKAAEPDATKCRKCNGNMRPGTYLAQTMSGTPDFPGDRHAVTVSPSGHGRLAECLKCDLCGWSVTAGKAGQG